MQIIYTPSVGVAVTVVGIFDENFVLAKGSEGEAGVETLGPAAFFSGAEAAKFTSDPEEDDPVLTIGGVDYRVVERRTAGLGAIVLPLRRVV